MEKSEHQMSVIVRTITNVLFPFIMVYGLYIIMHGHITPGGGFQGGVIVGAACVLLFVAFGYPVSEKYRKNLFTALESVGGLAFISVAFLGIAVAFFFNMFWHYRILFSGAPGTFYSAGMLPFMNMAVGTKVIAGIVTIIFAMGIRAWWLK